LFAGRNMTILLQDYDVWAKKADERKWRPIRRRMNKWRPTRRRLLR
jgi:hypothetical protein